MTYKEQGNIIVTHGKEIEKLKDHISNLDEVLQHYIELMQSYIKEISSDPKKATAVREKIWREILNDSEINYLEGENGRERRVTI